MDENYLLNKNISYIFTDFDDTIIYTSYANFLAYKKAVHEILNIDIFYIDERFTHNTLLEITNDKIIIDNIIKLKNKYYNDYLQYTYINYKLLNILKNIEYINVFLVTIGNRKRIENTLKYHNIQDLFDNQFFVQQSKIFSCKYLDVLMIINKYNANINLENIFIFENNDLEIVKAVNNGFKEDNIYKIPIKIYTKRS